MTDCVIDINPRTVNTIIGDKALSFQPCTLEYSLLKYKDVLIRISISACDDGGYIAENSELDAYGYGISREDAVHDFISSSIAKYELLSDNRELLSREMKKQFDILSGYFK